MVGGALFLAAEPARSCRPQQEQEQRTPGHFIAMADFELHRVLNVVVLLGQVGIDEPHPVSPAIHFGQGEDHNVVVSIGYQ